VTEDLGDDADDDGGDESSEESEAEEGEEEGEGGDEAAAASRAARRAKRAGGGGLRLTKAHLMLGLVGFLLLAQLLLFLDMASFWQRALPRV
jgi:hypothetical protein